MPPLRVQSAPASLPLRALAVPSLLTALHCMPRPRCTAQVYEQDVGKGAPGGEPAWRVDEAWMSTLDEGWDVKVVREACDKALQEVRAARCPSGPLG